MPARFGRTWARCAARARLLTRPYATSPSSRAFLGAQLPPDFTFVPDFLSAQEQRVLLKACLAKLDAMESREFRKRRRLHLQTVTQSPPDNASDAQGSSIEALFLPDSLYEFQEGHYDGVIRNYREMHVSTWPPSHDLEQVLGRVHSLLPDGFPGEKGRIQSHILHLASNGYIAPHIDNVGASGSWILGVSLGARRSMLLENVDHPDTRFEVALPSGSVYLQRDSVRYQFKH
ncbi:hypothetical protein AURDEDRAFT_88271, partial [Auricularia subglabra TFB-10046 SS5]